MIKELNLDVYFDTEEVSEEKLLHYLLNTCDIVYKNFDTITHAEVHYTSHLPQEAVEV